MRITEEYGMGLHFRSSIIKSASANAPHPPRRSTCPPRAPVHAPSSSVGTPLTSTWTMPRAVRLGAATVPRSRKVWPSNTARSAQAPGRIVPRSFQTQAAGRQPGETVDGRLRGQKTRIAHKVPEKPARPGIGPVEDSPLQRTVGAQGRGVRADHAARVGEHPAHLVFSVAKG